MGIGVAINFAISALDDYIHRHERLIEAAEKEASEYNSLSSELKSLDDQMESNSDRIKELQSLGTLTFVEQEELDNLQEANEKLETQLNLKNALANIESVSYTHLSPIKEKQYVLLPTLQILFLNCQTGINT